MKFSSTIAQTAILALTLSVSAAPVEQLSAHELWLSQFNETDIAEHPHLDTRATCPTVPEIEQWLADHTTVGANTVFWTSGADTDEAGRLATEVNGQYFYSAYGAQQAAWQKNCQPKDKLVKRMSEALALRSTGTAYIVLGEYAIGRDSVWVSVEYPNLHNVNIIAVNGENIQQRQAYQPHQNPWQKK